jgi:hypothetical protein
VVIMRTDLWIAAGAVAAAAVLALAWPAPEVAPTGSAAQAAGPAAPAASAARAAAERLAAAARLCADGCDALPSASGDGAVDAAPIVQADVALAAADLPALPSDLDDWALHPEAVPVPGEAPVVVRLHNVPVEPDDLDATPADESDPEAPPVEAPAGE